MSAAPAPVSAPWYARYAKALAAVLGTLTPQVVLQVLASNGVTVNGWLDLAITVVLGAAAVAIGPKNRP